MNRSKLMQDSEREREKEALRKVEFNEQQRQKFDAVFFYMFVVFDFNGTQ